MDLNLRRTLFVFAAQGLPPPENADSTESFCRSDPMDLGEFHNEGQNGSLFISRDGWRLRNDADYRAKVAACIDDETREELTHITSLVVVVHKTDPEFVYGMMGLADELVKLRWSDVKIAYGIDTSNCKSARLAVLECIREIREHTPSCLLPPVATDFDASQLLDFNSIIFNSTLTQR